MRGSGIEPHGGPPGQQTARGACASRAVDHSASGAVTITPSRSTAAIPSRVGLPWRPTVSREAVASDIQTVPHPAGRVHHLGITTSPRGVVPSCQAGSQVGPRKPNRGPGLSSAPAALSVTGHRANPGACSPAYARRSSRDHTLRRIERRPAEAGLTGTRRPKRSADVDPPRDLAVALPARALCGDAGVVHRRLDVAGRVDGP